MKNWNFYQITTIDNTLSIIVKSPMNIEDLSGYFAMKLRNSTYLTISQFDVKHIENAIIDREAIKIIHDTWVIEEKKTNRVLDIDTSSIVIPQNILKHLFVWDNRIVVKSFYEDEGGASKEYRIFAFIVNMCDTLGIELSYVRTRNYLILKRGNEVISLQADDECIFITFTRYIDKISTKVIDF